MSLSALTAKRSYSNDLGNAAKDNSSMIEFEPSFRTPYHSIPSALLAYLQKDPFDMMHFRILTRSLVPKSPNNSYNATALRDAGFFRSNILLAAMHYSWINGGLSGMEETYIYHKIEAIRLVNEHISDPAWTEQCANIIAALALAESGIGDIIAAEAHLGGLLTLINWRKPDELRGRWHGLFQRLILVASTFVAASKSHTAWKPRDTRRDDCERPVLQFAYPDTANFNAAEFDGTQLSPFYFEMKPNYGASNPGLETISMTNALQRLSSLPDEPKQAEHVYPSGSRKATRSASSTHANRPSSINTPLTDFVKEITVDQELTQVLLLETESYLTWLLFRPHAPPFAMTLGRQMYQPPERLTSMNSIPHSQPELRVGVDEHTLVMAISVATTTSTVPTATTTPVEV
ncbi:hypothetical protein SPBR_00598 [Sporothrix brasiliensis 5110]|uniref:Uncharacterized protein n=1 Tax=Sporothrix brasiliensis 5110 TaxID=1398154 RepID=A0A0C2FIN4_9PEZI|nr:uncharacterized protein SPBR_00598 [Sporothrix brasiliensis 5110]KIH90973.1 hypothetical protein SPBR_00598 [Sporothrix brasiliensis 5110]